MRPIITTNPPEPVTRRQLRPIDEPLTERQREVLATFAALTIEVGPTVRALGAALGISSTNGVSDHLVSLERRGLIRRWANAKSRAYVLTEEGKRVARGH